MNKKTTLIKERNQDLMNFQIKILNLKPKYFQKKIQIKLNRSNLFRKTIKSMISMTSMKFHKIRLELKSKRPNQLQKIPPKKIKPH